MAAIPEAVLAALLGIAGPNDDPGLGEPPAGSLVPTPPQEPVDLATAEYAVHARIKDIGDVIIPVSGLSWEEQVGELGVRITMQLPAVKLEGDPGSGQYLPDLVGLGTQITVLASLGDQDRREVARGTIEEFAPNDGTGGTYEVVAYDPIKNLLNSKFNKIYDAETYPTPGDILEAMFAEYNVPCSIPDAFKQGDHFQQPFVVHGESLGDILVKMIDIVESAEDAKDWCARTRYPDSVVSIEEVGKGTDDVYWLNQLPNNRVWVNVSSVAERHSIVDLVTKLTVTGTNVPNTDPPQVGVIGTIDTSGDTYGIRRDDIYAVQAKESYQSITQVGHEAEKIMRDAAQPKVDRSITAPDIPFLRKFDLVRVTAGTMDDHFSVASVTHDESSRTMNVALSTLGVLPNMGTFAPAEGFPESLIPQPGETGGGGGGGAGAGGNVTPAQVYALAVAAGFKGADAITATAISLAEDATGNPTIEHKNNNNTIDLGLWQINSIHWGQGSIPGKDALKVPLTNAQAAYTLYQGRGGKFGDWATFNDGSYASHLGAAQQAAAGPKADLPTATSLNTSSGAAGKRTVLDSTMKSWLGVPYALGGTSRAGIDCSAFTQTVFKAIGVDIPRTAQGQYGAVDKISASQAGYGDLVFFHGTYNTPDYISHVGIVVGPGQMIGAASGFVKQQSFTDPWWRDHLVGFGRVKLS